MVVYSTSKFVQFATVSVGFYSVPKKELLLGIVDVLPYMTFVVVRNTTSNNN